MRYLLHILFSFLISISSFIAVNGQSSSMVTHYSRNIYSAGSQNWSLDMDTQGFIYVANNDGLMKYDGVRWALHKIPSQTIVRSVLAAADGRIYIGSYEEFGYWKKTSANQMEYHSLMPLLKDKKLRNTEIWKIAQVDNKIYFQGFSALLVYDGQTVRSIELPGPIVFMLKGGKRLFVQAVKGNLFEIINDKLVNIDRDNVLRNTEVKTVLPYSKNLFIIGTSSNGLYIYDGKTIKPWEVDANSLLKECQINNGIIFDNKLVFGTIVKGVFILDSVGNILFHIHSGNDLQNNTVLSLFNDNNQSIWVGLDNGIDNISFNNPLEVYQHYDEAKGAVYTAALVGDILYIGTNRGIFTYSKKGNKFIFNGLFRNSQGQVWQLKEIDGTLFCGHTNGTYIIENNNLKLISNVNGGYALQKISVKGEDYLIQSTYSTLVIYKRSGKSWVYSHQVEGFIEPARFIEADHLGNIWIGHLVKGLYRIRLNDQLSKITEIQFYKKKDGLPSDFNIRVFKIGNRIVFSTGEKLYTWDDLNRKIIPWGNFNQKLNGFETATSISQVDENSYWFVSHNEAAQFNVYPDKTEMKVRLILPEYNISMVDNYENIIRLNAKMHLICLENGFAIYNNQNVKSFSQDQNRIIFRDFSFWNVNGNNGKIDLTKSSHVLGHSYNNITISFASQRNPCSRKLFQFMLEGIDSEWSQWTEKAEASYTRLPVGKFTFKVRTLTPNGGTTEPVMLHFTIKPAWYASVIATLIYIFLGIGGILLSQYYYRRRLENHHRNLIRIADEERESEKQQIEQEIIKLQNEKLQTEISHKNLQVADSTMSIIKKNEVLIEIKNELEKQKEELGSRYPARYLQRLTTLIDRNISNDNDWEMFETLFDQAHENFFKRLKQSYSELTQSDLKLCAYLKLNLSSKEIAPLLNISIRGVEIRRYRLRKRLALNQEENLVEFIMKF